MKKISQIMSVAMEEVMSAQSTADKLMGEPPNPGTVGEEKGPIVTVASDDNTAAVIVDGPLSFVIGRALNIAYSKDADVNKVATESMMIDLVRQAALKQRMEEEDGGSKQVEAYVTHNVSSIVSGSARKEDYAKIVPASMFNQLRASGAEERFIVLVNSGNDDDHGGVVFDLDEDGPVKDQTYSIESYSIVVNLKKHK